MHIYTYKIYCPFNRVISILYLKVVKIKVSQLDKIFNWTKPMSIEIVKRLDIYILEGCLFLKDPIGPLFLDLKNS